MDNPVGRFEIGASDKKVEMYLKRLAWDGFVMRSVENKWR